MASVLHEVQLNLVDQGICQHILQTLKPELQNLTVVCAGPERGGKDACQVLSQPPSTIFLKRSCQPRYFGAQFRKQYFP